MSKDYTVRWFNEGDVEAYIAGLNKALYDGYDEAVFDWKWRRNPFKQKMTSIAVVEHPVDGPIAFNSFLPLEIRRGKQVFRAVQGCDGFVDERHRRKGLFQRTLHFLENEMGNLDAEFLMGFNLVEAAGAARKAGSELAYDVNKCFLKPSEIKPSKRHPVELVPIDVDELHMLYMEWALRSRFFSVNRSLDYLRWKLAHPFKQIHTYGVELEGETVGYVVTDKVKEGEKTTLTINDYNPGLMNKYIGSIMENLKGLYTDVTVFEMDTMQGGERQKSARRLGFEVVPWYQVIMKALRGTEQRDGVVYRNGIRLSYIGNWHITEGDIY